MNKVIWLCWGYRFWFLLICFILHVHEIWPFMPNSSVFILLMLRALYRMICKNAKSFFGRDSLNVSSVKLHSNFFFNFFGFFIPFRWEWQLALYILSDFLGIKKINGLNDLLASTTSVVLMTSTASFCPKTFNLEKKNIFLMVSYFFLLEQGP